MGLKYRSKVDYWLTEDGLMLLEAWARDGLTMDEIAQKIGVQRPRLHEWRNKYDEIDIALSTAKEIVDYKVENALLKSALGFKTQEIKVTIGRKIFNGETVELLKETTTREIAPNVQACITWLNNRQFDKWKRNRDRNMEIQEEDGNISITIVRGTNDDLGDNVNKEVTFTKKAEPETVSDETDVDYWPDDWEDDDEEE